MEWVNWRENTIQILASIKEEDKNQTKIKLNKEETDNDQILLEAELLTPPDVILKQAVAEEFTEWEQWSKCSCSEKEWIFFGYCRVNYRYYTDDSRLKSGVTPPLRESCLVIG